MDVGRRAELEANLADVRARITTAADAAGRDPADVTVIAVTKTWPLSDIRILRDLGITEFGENRDQEARPKAEEWARIDGRTANWHFIGQLQSNKAKSVAEYAQVVHTVDRASLVEALRKPGRPLDCLVQLSIDGDTARGGCARSGIQALADSLSAPLSLRGIMAVAPIDMDPERAFAVVREVHDELSMRFPDATMRCIGMSDDLEAAVMAGATHVRIGSALLGKRPPAH